MHHPWARVVVERLLVNPALGASAASQMAMACLYDDERLPASVVDLCFHRSLQLPADPGQPVSDPLNQEPVPEDSQQWLVQVLPQVANLPDGCGLGLVLAVGLADLWPHVAHDERAALRAAFIAGLHERRGAGLSRDQMKIWNRRLGTLELTSTPGLERLAGVLEASSAEAAYARLSAHLHRPGRQLAVMLGGLAATTCDHGGAHPERLILLAAAAALARVADRIPPDLLALLLAQLGHDIWRYRAETPDQAPAVRHLEDAIFSGDGPAAARAARAMAGSSVRFWSAIAPLLPRADDPGTLLGIAAVASRSQSHAALPPEDAAALAQALASCIAPS